MQCKDTALLQITMMSTYYF